MSWGIVKIYYADSSVSLTDPMRWKDEPKQGVQFVTVSDGRYKYLFGNYDFYALWIEEEKLVVVQGGPTEVYGHSQIVKLMNEDVLVVDIGWEDIDQITMEKINAHRKDGLMIPTKEYNRIHAIASGDCGC